MATIAGTIQHVSILNTGTKGAINVAKVVVDFPAYTSSDDAAITAITTAIQNSRRNGKTATLRNIVTIQAGSDGTQDIFFNASSSWAATISGTGATGNLTATAYGTEITSSAATTVPITLAVTFSEA